MFKSSRRNVLKMLGAAPVAPLAAKIANDEMLGKLALNSNSQALATGLPTAPGTWRSISPTSATNNDIDARGAASYYVKTFGLPEYVEDQMRATARYIGVLDPDLAAKRSWSMSVKIQEQRQRNFKIAVEQLHKNVKFDKARGAFEAITGWSWPW